MKIKQTIKLFVIGALLSLGFVTALQQPVSADCGGVDTSIINCDSTDTDPNSTDIVTKELVADDGLRFVLNLAINALNGLIILAALAGIVYGAVLYTSAGGSQEKVKKAIGVFTNVAIGFIAYALMFVALNFLIPGGLF